MNRREMLTASVAAGLAATSLRTAFGATGTAKFTMDLCPGKVGIKAKPREALVLAKKHGFTSIEPNARFLAGLSKPQRREFADSVEQHGLVWGAGGLPVDFRNDNATFKTELTELPRLAKAMQEVGVTRIGTWIMPSHDQLTYTKNFKLHATRLRRVGKVLSDHGMRLGLEYVGTPTLLVRARYPFIHTMAEGKDLLSSIKQDNVGFVLDTWHWHMAEESGDDIRSLKNEDVVAVDLNDAPAGIPNNQQQDNQRELAAATGVIDVKSFLQALIDIGYDGPIRSEPFNQPLRELDDDAAAAATSAAMKRAFATVGAA